MRAAGRYLFCQVHKHSREMSPHAISPRLFWTKKADMRHHTTSAVDAPHGPIARLCSLLKEETARFGSSYLLSSHSCVRFAVERCV